MNLFNLRINQKLGIDSVSESVDRKVCDVLCFLQLVSISVEADANIRLMIGE